MSVSNLSEQNKAFAGQIERRQERVNITFNSVIDILVETGKPFLSVQEIHGRTGQWFREETLRDYLGVLESKKLLDFTNNRRAITIRPETFQYMTDEQKRDYQVKFEGNPPLEVHPQEIITKCTVCGSTAVGGANGSRELPFCSNDCREKYSTSMGVRQ